MHLTSPKVNGDRIYLSLVISVIGFEWQFSTDVQSFPASFINEIKWGSRIMRYHRDFRPADFLQISVFTNDSQNLYWSQLISGFLDPTAVRRLELFAFEWVATRKQFISSDEIEFCLSISTKILTSGIWRYCMFRVENLGGGDLGLTGHSWPWGSDIPVHILRCATIIRCSRARYFICFSLSLVASKSIHNSRPPSMVVLVRTVTLWFCEI